MIEQIHHLVVFTTDMKRSIQFYVSVLGLELRFESDQWSEIIVGNGVYIGLHYADKVSGIKSGGNTTQISFKTNDIDETYEKLKNKGVKFPQEIKELASGIWVAHFTDPDGNQLSLFQNKN